MSLDATPGGASSDSFVTVATADNYFDERLHIEVWEDQGLIEKEKALKWATKILDRLPWSGVKNTDSQALRWPRAYVDDLEGDWLDESTIPNFLVHATCELAIELAGSDRTTDNASDQLKALAVGPIRLDFNQDYVKEVFPETVKEIIAPYLISSPNGIESMSILRA